MPDYSKGKIYKIVADTDEEYKPYVGSTIQTLANRMSSHRGCYKRGIFDYSSFDLFERFGVDKCKIFLIEDYPCKTFEQLISRERYWFDTIECCNKRKPFITEEEFDKYRKKYKETNKEQIFEKNKIYRDEHKEHYKKYFDERKEELAKYRKKYYQENKEQFAKKSQIYRESNKEQISEKMKETFTCDCGSVCRKNEKKRHERSQKHISFISK